MAFKRLDPQDFVVSSDSITTAAWTNNTPTISTFFTNSAQEASNAGLYYLDVYSTESSLSTAEVQFAVSYANVNGSGSAYFNDAVPGKSPSRTVYGQFQDLVLGDENASFVFGDHTGSDFYIISVERARYKEKFFMGTMTLDLKAPAGAGTLSLTDDSSITSTVTYTEAGRKFNLVSGSAGTVYTGTNSNGWTSNSGSYGWVLPDIGIILLNADALDGTSGSEGGIALGTLRQADTNNNNPKRLYLSISGSGTGNFTLNSEETLSSDYVFVRARNSEFNYSENPSFISGSTGEVLYPIFINQPTTYVTTVGLYNDTSDLLAVAKLSKPLSKDFTKEALIRVKLDF